jgi:hypothetical protein
MINFCTLFDSNYLTRGLAMYESLCRTTAFHLFVIAFNDECYQYLERARLPHMTVIALKDFEDEALLRVKPNRSFAEYCWTCTPSVIQYCILNYNLSSCTYIDADMIFYNDPKILLDEMKGRSVLITEHRYTADYEQSAISGKYCVQFMCFKNNEAGMEVLNWWRERCLEWCYDRLEDGKFGDQKYLDDWTERFNCVHVMQYPGGGIAPWNVQQYDWIGTSILREKKSGKNYSLIFFHFHGVKFFTNGLISCCPPIYDLSREIKTGLYYPYFRMLITLEKQLRAEGVSFNINGAKSEAPRRWQIYWEYFKQRLVLYKLGTISFRKIKPLQFKEHYHFFKHQQP